MRGQGERGRWAVTLATIAVAVAGTLTGAPAALADGTVTVTPDPLFGDEVAFTAGPGDADNVVVSGTREQVTITSAFPITVDPAACDGTGTTTVVCDGAAIVVRATLGDAVDRLEVTGPLPTSASGGDGDDTLIGGPADDQLFGDDGADQVSGNGGDDTIGGGTNDAFDDVLMGGPGADFFTILRPLDGADLLDGGPGIDRLSAIGSGFLEPGYSYTLGDDLANDGLDNQRAHLRGIEDIDTGEGNDFVRGTDEPNVITTVDGFDDVDGLGGPDFISLGTQDDTVEARDGFSDRIMCSSGNDTARVDQLDVLSDCENVTTTVVEPFGTEHPPPVAPAPPNPGPAAPPPAPPPPPAPVPVAVAPDRRAPVCRLSAARRIRYPHRPIVVTATCDEPSSLRVTLSARLTGRVIAARVGDVTLAERSLARKSGARRMRLRIPARLRAGLGRRAVLRLRVEATDAAGNRTANVRTIRVRRR